MKMVIIAHFSSWNHPNHWKTWVRLSVFSITELEAIKCSFFGCFCKEESKYQNNSLSTTNRHHNFARVARQQFGQLSPLTTCNAFWVTSAWLLTCEVFTYSYIAKQHSNAIMKCSIKPVQFFWGSSLLLGASRTTLMYEESRTPKFFMHKTSVSDCNRLKVIVRY